MVAVCLVTPHASPGCGVVYTKDHDSSDNVMAVSYSGGALSLSLSNANFVSRWGKETKNEWGMKWINDHIVSVKDLRGHGLSK